MLRKLDKTGGFGMIHVESADKNMNDVHGVLQVLSALPELKIKE